jgi:prevent-host-death family protein
MVHDYPVKTVNVHEATTTLSALLERAHNGEEIILAKAGKPYARLVPLAEPRERVPGRYARTESGITSRNTSGSVRPDARCARLLEGVGILSIDPALSDLGAERIRG